MLISSVRFTLTAVALVVSFVSRPLLAEESPSVQQKAIERYAGKYRLSLEESRDRLLLQDRAEGIDDRLVALLGDQFAGLWFDHSDRGRLKIGMARGAITRQGEVLGLVREFGVQDGTDLVPVTYTSAELDRKQDTLRDSLRDMILAGHARTGQNPKWNKVVVTAITVLPASEELRILEASTIPGVRVKRVDEPDLFGRAQACDSISCDPPLRGGNQVWSQHARPLHFPTYTYCTSAFTAKHRVNNDLLVITAGHCIIDNWYFGSYWSTPAVSAPVNDNIGGNYGFVLGGAPGVDAGVIKVRPDFDWYSPAPEAAIVIRAEPNGFVTQHHYEITHDSTSTLGQTLCMSGWAHNLECAEVSDLGQDHVIMWWNGPIVLKNSGELDTCHTSGGDSGSPVFKNHRAKGIHIGQYESSTSCYTMYQGIRGAENAMNVDILTQ